MTREEIDILWSKALVDAVRAGEIFTRYHFAALVAAASDSARLQAQQELAECRAACVRAEHEAQRARGKA